MTPSELIYHLTIQSDWQTALQIGEYRGNTLETVHFIHCSNRTQVLEVANRIFKSRLDLLLLELDPALVVPEIKWEISENDDTYPHIYGPLNLNAIRHVWAMPPEADGTFVWPVGAGE